MKLLIPSILLLAGCQTAETTSQMQETTMMKPAVTSDAGATETQQLIDLSTGPDGRTLSNWPFYRAKFVPEAGRYEVTVRSEADAVSFRRLAADWLASRPDAVVLVNTDPSFVYEATPSR